MNPKALTLALLLGAVAVMPAQAAPADARRLDEVAARGRQVMPFSLEQTLHIFTATAAGGVQQVRAQDPADTRQVGLIRAHLADLAAAFRQGDFTAPAHIHGAAMPGLAALRQAKPGQIEITYRDLPAGAEVVYATPDAALVAALHRWFDAQLSDHARHAVAGGTEHAQHRQSGGQP